jgi:diaminohydroxyphosphoribosylaminopyrimidine deaminase/5-amino-6-(5-phosphoribosylamino)uracil reductase
MRCVELAQLGRGFVAPNPLVGALIVHKDKIIGEGYHQRFGEAHAEVNAINSVKDKSLLKNATIYVSLEPCSHFGKTPPCADLIMQHKFRRVVIGCTDTFSEVNGSGIKKLQESRTDVSVGILEKECRELNLHFFTFHEKKDPMYF